MKDVDIVYRTMFSELAQRTLDASFVSEFPVEGQFVRQVSKGREFWYFQNRVDGSYVRKYVGPCSDAEVNGRVARFNELKDDFRARRKLVSTLVRTAYLSPPERFTGDVVEKLADAGLFRLRAVLVGTVAYQCYSGHLGVRLPSSSMQTGDADFAQFHSVSASLGDSIPPVLGLLKEIDPTFREIPHQTDGRFSTQFENAARFRVEFLTPNRGSDDHSGRAAPMPSLGGAAAQPLRFLDFLIHEPVRTVMLHRAGVPVTVPAPERYAVHKLIVASRRREDAAGATKRDKDVMQAASLVEALVHTRRQDDLAMAWTEAWDRGPAWREGMTAGLSYVPDPERETVTASIAEALSSIGEEPGDYGFPGGRPAP